MRVLVTGATGFIGGHACRWLLDAGYDVSALVRPRTESPALDPSIALLPGDVTVGASLDEAMQDVDAVLHLAGATRAHRQTTYQRTNIEGTRATAAAARRAGVRTFIFVSSMAAQGPSRPGHPHIFPGSEAPINAYGRSKLAAEQLLLDSFSDLDLTILRPSTVFGPSDRNIITIARLVQRRVVPIVTGLKLSMIHVDDLCQLFLQVLKHPKSGPGPFFVAHPEPITFERVVDLVEGIIQTEAPVLRVPINGRLLKWLAPITEQLATVSGLGQYAARLALELSAPAWVCTPEQASATYQWTPTTGLTAGLRDTFDWYQEHGWLA